MATAETVGAEVSPETQSLFKSLWSRWLRKIRRDRARQLSQVKFRLTREGVHFIGILIFIFIGAVIRDISLLILLAGAMIGLLLLQWRFNSSTLVGLQVTRRIPRNVAVNADAEVEVRLVNPKFWLGAWLVLVEDRVQKIQPNRARVPVRGTALLDSVRPSSFADSRYKLRFHERGRYAIGPTTITTRFPLGLGRGWRTMDNSSEILVHPKRGELLTRAAELMRLDQHGHAKSASNAGSQEGEFFGLRPWETGDSKRWIHWRTTARLGQLSVRQFEQRQQRQVCVVLDLYQEKGNVDEEAIETAISFVATLAKKSVSEGRDKLSVGVAGKTTQIFAAVRSPVLVDNLLDTLAVVEAQAEPNLGEAIRGMSVPLMSNPYLLVISTRADCMDQLLQSDLDSQTRRLLNIARTRWINVAAQELETYFQWT